MRLDELEKMKIAMKRAGLTQKKLAPQVSVHFTTLGGYLAGHSPMPADVQERVWACIKHAAEAKSAEIDRKAAEDKRFVMEPVKAVAI